jgi:hypothetical protein
MNNRASTVASKMDAPPGLSRRALPLLVVLLSLGVFAWAMASAAGDWLNSKSSYPEFSSLSAGPDGTKLLFDSLARIPGLHVERTYTPIDSLASHDAAVFLLGTWPFDLEDADQRHSLEEIAGRGNRLILGLHGVSAPLPKLEQAWGLQLVYERDKPVARRSSLVTTKSWKVLEQADGKTLTAVRAFGKGSILVSVEPSQFTNEAVLLDWRLPFVTTAIGLKSHIVFDEEHFGFAVNGSVVGLARHFRLTGLAFGLALAGALFLWKSSFGFPPPPMLETRRLEGRASQAGLATLLRRHIRTAGLMRACWDAWLEANRHRVPGGRIQEVESIVGRVEANPLEAASKIRAALRPKGML